MMIIIILLLSIKFIWKRCTGTRRHASIKINRNIKKAPPRPCNGFRGMRFFTQIGRVRASFLRAVSDGGQRPSNRRPATAVVVPTSLSVGLSLRPGRTSVRIFNIIFVCRSSNASCRKCLLKYLLYKGSNHPLVTAAEKF